MCQRFKIALVVVLSVLLAACAGKWEKEGDYYTFNLQRSNTAPKEGVKVIETIELEAGDILFSSATSAQSIGIRLFNNAPISHSFIYLGDGLIAEAVGSGVQIISLTEALEHANLVAVYRYPGLTSEDTAKMREFANSLDGSKYNFVGIAKQMPYSITRKACELPVNPRFIRQACLNSMGYLFVSPLQSERYFCSQFVVEAFNVAGKPLTHKNPEWVSPSDILHMREDDVPSIRSKVELAYVGHLACSVSIWNSSCSAQKPKDTIP
ncbi:YiiX/YebB-like N1pC/P60 family cysteine hydrolase [Pseudomonas sp. F1_0610]|uniref:YiiX/YebB-like N1pC/P60 family cysteine hydrolase n=1 Tax=Pseudomonas sp. F1_0610 TaxID=3114284 RepID=UPI0039C34083